MKWEKPDGVIEYGMSGCCCPPGVKRGGLHTCACTSWYRVNGGEWKHLRRWYDFQVFAEAAESCADFTRGMEDFENYQTTHDLAARNDNP